MKSIFKHWELFFKQWGTWGEDGVKRNKKINGRLLEGQEWNNEPVAQSLASE